MLIGPDNKLIEQDIYPIGCVSVLEATFPSGLSPAPTACSSLEVKENESIGLSSIS